MRRPQPRLQPALLFITVCALYLPYINNPLVFDDLYFFLAGAPERLLANGFQFGPRWWVYSSLALTFVHIGQEIAWQRLGNLLLHTATGLALYFLLRRLLNDLGPSRAGALRPEWAALLAALLFVLHPVAVYGAGYLIQRTIVLATLFSLLTWLAFWKGMQGSRAWLWASLPLYFLAVFSKEHAVMAPAVCLALWLLHRRSGLASTLRLGELAGVILAQGAVAAWVTFLAIGGAYEILGPEHLQELGEQGFDLAEGMARPLSVLTQAGLFFKYLGLWALPNVGWMSVDMREPFALTFSAPRLFVLAAFLAWPVLSGWLLWKGRVRGLLGLGLLAPWLLFATEIVGLRMQEIFVLYRSYLWAPFLFVLPALGLARMTVRAGAALGGILAVALFALAFDRLTSFSHPYLLWDEAARVAEDNIGQQGVTGVARIYHNRGLALYREGLVPKAIESYDRALALKPDYSHVYNDRGAARLDLKEYPAALKDFEEAIRLKRDLLKPYAGRALALEGLGRTPEATAAFAHACRQGWKPACEKAKSP